MSSLPLAIGWNAQRVRAWMGDAYLLIDLRIGALLIRVPGPELQEWVSMRIRASYLRHYWESLEDTSGWVQPTGSSDHSFATAFEANYVGAFRSLFLVHVFGPRVAKKVMSLSGSFSFDFLYEQD